MKLYILGPMTGYEDFNRKAFREARVFLKSLGHEVVCPDELDDLDPAKGRQWADYMRRDIPYLCQVDSGIALPGWQESRGALLEACILNALGKPVYNYSDVRSPRIVLDPIDPADLPEAVLPSRSIDPSEAHRQNT